MKENTRSLRDLSVDQIVALTQNGSEHPCLYLKGDHALAQKLRHELRGISSKFNGSEDMTHERHSVHLWPAPSQEALRQAITLILSEEYTELEVLI